MAQLEGIPRESGAVNPVPASGRPDAPIPVPHMPPPLAPARNSTPTGFQRIYHWRDPVGWLLPLASAFASFLAGAVLFRSIIVSLALLALIFVHEIGHVIALRLRHIPASAPIFVPLIGAFVVPGHIRRARDMAFVALAGPFTGGLGALACLLIARHASASECLMPVYSGLHMNDPCISYLYGSGYRWLLLAHVGFLLNLVNLLPLMPLDGGRVAWTISRRLWPLGILVSFALLLLDHEPLIWIIAVITFVLTLWAFWQREPLAPIPATPRAKVTIAVTYVGLALLLGAGMLLTQDYMQFMQANFFNPPV